MNREILFRAKVDWDFPWYDSELYCEDKLKNEWVYGFYTLNSSILPVGQAVIETTTNDFKVLDDTVCQYTGYDIPVITDDKVEYVKLFEGDICELYNHMISTGNEYEGYTYNDYLGVISYIQGCFCFIAYRLCRRGGITEVKDIDTFTVPLYSIHNLCKSLKIVGNVFDNPELLEKDEDDEDE